MKISNISYMPVPDFGDLLAMHGRNPNEGTIAAPWCHDDERAHWYSRSAWALADIAKWWAQNHDNRQPRVWLPDYFCNQSTEPLRRIGVHLTFYPLSESLEPDWPCCEKLAIADPPDIFILVHYFGRAADVPAAREFTTRTNTLLVEDAVQVLVPSADIGVHGDFTVYSPHKWLPIPDGAILLSRQVNFRPGADDDATAPSVVSWVLKRLVQKGLPFSVRRRNRLAFLEDPAFVAYPPTPKPSLAGLRLLTRQLPALATIATRRRQFSRNLSDIWRRTFADHPSATSMNDVLAPDAAPYRFIVDVDDSDAAEDLYLRLNRSGVPAETWPDMPPEVLKNLSYHADAIRRRRTRLFLPVHQSVRVEDYEECLGRAADS